MLAAGTDASTWLPALHDPAPVDLAISLCFMAAITVVGLAAVFVAGQRPAERRRWAAVALVLTLLLINQQLDLHVFVVRWAAALFETAGWSVHAPGVAAFIGLDLALMGFAVGAILLALRRSRSPGLLAVTGLLLLAVHGLGRAAMFAHLLHDSVAAHDVHTMLRGVEVVGLALVAMGALRWRHAKGQPVGGPVAGAAKGQETMARRLQKLPPFQRTQYPHQPVRQSP